MFPLGPLDPLLVVLYAAFKVRPLRALILFFGLVPAGLYALPAQSCGCFRTPFVRCSSVGREGAYFAAMKSDLKNLASQQEIFFSDYRAYSVRSEQLGFVSSNGVRVSLYASSEGWAAHATHDALGQVEWCAMQWGRAPSHPLEELDGVESGALVCSR
jgi:hypothetical protein